MVEATEEVEVEVEAMVEDGEVVEEVEEGRCTAGDPQPGENMNKIQHLRVSNYSISRIGSFTSYFNI